MIWKYDEKVKGRTFCAPQVLVLVLANKMEGEPVRLLHQTLSRVVIRPTI